MRLQINAAVMLVYRVSTHFKQTLL